MLDLFRSSDDKPKLVGDRSATILKTRKRDPNFDLSSLERTVVDVNGDDRPDQWEYYKNGASAVTARDFNFDGNPEVWRYYGANGRVVEEEYNLDPDPHIDVIHYLEGGTTRRKLISVDFQGKFTIEKFYDKQGNLLRVERDSDGDGQPETWEYFEDGKRVRIGWDEDLDGVADTFNKY